jgi:hypothetical protein
VKVTPADSFVAPETNAGFDTYARVAVSLFCRRGNTFVSLLKLCGVSRSAYSGHGRMGTGCISTGGKLPSTFFAAPEGRFCTQPGPSADPAAIGDANPYFIQLDAENSPLASARHLNKIADLAAAFRNRACPPQAPHFAFPAAFRENIHAGFRRRRIPAMRPAVADKLPSPTTAR